MSDFDRLENVSSASAAAAAAPREPDLGAQVLLPSPAGSIAPRFGAPISIYRRGHPLSIDIRSRVMLYLQQGLKPKLIAQQLQISSRTVGRYKKLADAQQLSVPVVCPRGGYRSSVALMNREQILALARLLFKLPKLTIRELKQLAVHEGILDENKVPSDTSVWRAIKKLNIDWKKASYMDPKGLIRQIVEEPQRRAQGAIGRDELGGAAAATVAPAAPAAVAAGMDPGAKAILEERAAFRFMQRLGTDGQLNPYNLFFMDESNFRLYDQQHHVWAHAHQRGYLLRPKGVSPTFNVIATIGVEKDSPGGMFMHYVIIPPRRDFRGVPKTFMSYEFRNPKAGIDLGFSVSQIRAELSLDQMRQLMNEQQLRIPPGLVDADETAVTRELRRILIQVRTHGKVGLHRELPARQAYLGGSIKAFRSTAGDVVDYVERLLIPWYVKRKLQGLVTECNEDSDGILGCPDSGHHFSIPYMEPREVARTKLVQETQRKQRQWQRASHQLAVYRRSKKGQSEGGQRLLDSLVDKARGKQHELNVAQEALVRYDRQLDRSRSYVPFQDEIAGIGYKSKLTKKTLIWDGASTHGATKITSARRKSFWHDHAKKVGLAGVIFLPPRTPTLNPIELMFGFLKHHVRKQCPDEGYTPSGLLQAIHNAFRLVRPEMIQNWIKKAGYKFTDAQKVRGAQPNDHVDDERRQVPPADPGLGANNDAMDMEMDDEILEAKYEEKEEQVAAALPQQQQSAAAAASDQAVEFPEDVCYSIAGKQFPRKASFICMDEHGSVKRRKLRGHIRFSSEFDTKLVSDPKWATHIEMQNVAREVQALRSFDITPLVLPPSEEEAFAMVAKSRRWAGLGPEPPSLSMQMPESVARSQEGELWEIDGIVEHRNKGLGTYEYLVRYKGYTEADDEWLRAQALETAPGAIKEYWARMNRKP